jgi:HAD superfamily hydrolase (TIGR01509 family)
MDKARAVLCDFDGVMVNRFTVASAKRFCSENSIVYEHYQEIANCLGQQLDIGELSGGGFFAHIAKEFDLDMSPQEIQAFFAEADKHNIKKDERLYGWLADAKKLGIIVGVASNVSKGLSAWLDSLNLYEVFDRRYFSYGIGCGKVNPLFWRRVTEDLQLAASEIAFVDDSPVNVDGATRAGLLAKVHVHTPDTIEWLETVTSGV